MATIFILAMFCLYFRDGTMNYHDNLLRSISKLKQNDSAFFSSTCEKQGWWLVYICSLSPGEAEGGVLLCNQTRQRQKELYL